MDTKHIEELRVWQDVAGERKRSPYGSVASFYDTVLTMSGFRRGVRQFLDRIDFGLPKNPKILDAGCGTGLLSLYLAKRFPEGEIIAFDIDRDMLRQFQEFMLSRYPELERRITIVEGDLSNPFNLQIYKTGAVLSFPEEHFDAVMVSGALEHVNLNESTKNLITLLKKGGTFFNLSMRNNIIAAVLKRVLHFRPYSVEELCNACSEAGLTDIVAVNLQMTDFPANLSRLAIIAKKTL